MQLITAIINFIKTLFTPTAVVPVSPPVSPVTPPVPVPIIIPAPFIDPKLINAIIMIESGGDVNAIGDHGNAFGCMQIWQGDTDIANGYLGTHYKASDCLGNKDLAITLFTAYFHVFSSLVTNEDRAKAWNGGAGWKTRVGNPEYATYMANIDAYWAKVQQYL